MRLLRHWNPITPPSGESAAPRPRAAVVVPIYNEDTHRVFAGLQAIWTELAAEAEAARCDLFILSDTTDPDIWLAELEAWQDFLQATPGAERVFYRRRLRNVQRKSGNIEDFVTRWGGAYGYMVVLDANSLMTGQAIAELVRRMDANPAVGLIQAPPKLVRGHSLFARLLQFSGELYGPLSATGISYWALGEGNYWGHNAIIRVAPFAELCSLPLLPGRAPLGGEIMSHDFVEAALLRRGGWQVWIADDVPGSYEEPPPTVADFATRDRRWCQGNLQHMKVLFTRNLHWVSRLHLGIGIMAYLTSPLWLVFLLLSAAQAWELTYTRPVYFTEGLPFPVLPVSVEAEAAVPSRGDAGPPVRPQALGPDPRARQPAPPPGAGRGSAPDAECPDRDRAVGPGGAGDDGDAHHLRPPDPARGRHRLDAAAAQCRLQRAARDRAPVRLGDHDRHRGLVRHLVGDTDPLLLADAGVGGSRLRHPALAAPRERVGRGRSCANGGSC